VRAHRWLVFAALTACKQSPGAPAPTDPPGIAAPVSVSVSVPAPVPVPVPAPVSVPVPTPTLASAPSDGGTSACHVIRGPIELPVRSPSALVVRPDALDVVLNDDGKPSILSFPTPSPAKPPPAVAALPSASPPLVTREAAERPVAAGYPVACAVSADRVFCADRSGAVHRTTREGTGDVVAASSRSGSRISAATLAENHSALGYLASRQTSEGWVSEAWLTVDDEAPVRISEDGCGATSLVLASRKAAVVAVTVDARAALTALHVRPVTFEGRAQLGEDAVVFVGGPGDRRTAATIALPPSGPSWALLPIVRDIGSFGMAVVRVDEPAQVDEPVLWSMYPNGLDPAPVASVVEGSTTWVARVLPQTAEPGATRVLQLGGVDSGGAFVAHDILATAAKLTDVTLAADRHGALWVAWVDGTGSWLERLVCR
jgi:hypothetical protein